MAFADMDLEHYRHAVRGLYRWVLVLEVAVGVLGVWKGLPQIAVVGFGMALYLLAIRWMLRKVGRWPT